MQARTISNEQDKDQISRVSSCDLYWENKMYKRKRSIVKYIELIKLDLWPNFGMAKY